MKGSLLFFSLLLLGMACIAGQGNTMRALNHRQLRFTENKGQWNEKIKFVTDVPNGSLWLEKNAFYYFLLPKGNKGHGHHPGDKERDVIKGHSFKTEFVNANPNAVLQGQIPFDDYANYFLGNNPKYWAGGAKIYAQVNYTGLYKGIDMAVYTRNNKQIKYDLVVKPGANAAQIKLRYTGADLLAIRDGALVIKTTVDDVIEEKPYAYQLINGVQTPVACNFVLEGNETRFEFPNGYNKAYTLTIDPNIVFASYTGATGDNWGYTATYDNQGCMYLGGYINLLYPAPGDYPTTPGAFQTTWGGGSNTNGILFECDMGITKFTPDGTALVYSTFVGGSDNETPHSLVVDPQGNLIIYGVSYSFNYPVTGNAYQSNYRGNGDIVVTKLNAAGSALIGSTFMGGTANEGINYDPEEFTAGNLKWNYGDQNRGEVNIDGSGNIYVASCTRSPDYPTTSGALQALFGGGQDGCAFKLNSDCSQLIWSTFLGGLVDDACYSLDIGPGGSLYVAGGTMSPNFPTTAGSLHPTYMGGNYDGFLSLINPTGTQLISSSFIGTPGDDQVYFVKLDGVSNAYFIGQTTGQYPVVNAGYSNANSGQFIAKVNPQINSVFYSTVFGNGSGEPNISPTAFLVDTCENIYVAGWTNTSNGGTNTFSPGGCCNTFINPGRNMPLTPDAYQSNTDGVDFYFIVLSKDVDSLLYATYYGGDGVDEHVDGGTSRFDKRGVIYEAMCAGCNQTQTPTTPGVWAPNNLGSNCNELGLKMEFNLSGVYVDIATTTEAEGCIPLTVEFQAISSNAKRYKWYFGNGDSSDLQNPVYTFTDTGLFTVILIGIDSNTCNVIDTAFTYIYARGDELKAVLSDTFNCVPFTVNLDLPGVYPGTIYQWNMGDGNVLTGNPITHTYNNKGVYQVQVIMTDPATCNISDTATAVFIAIDSSADASFAMTRTFYGCDSVFVTVTSTYPTPDYQYWDFGDGTITSANPASHMYNQGGTFIISHYLADTSKICRPIDTAQIAISLSPLSINIDIPDTGGCYPFTAEFMGQSGLLSTDFTWYFGDGTNAVGDTVTHTYNNVGIFNVVVVAVDTNACVRTDSAVATIAVINDSVTADFDLIVLNDCDSNLQVSLVNQSTNALQYFWDLGDSTLSTQTDVSHTYNLPGTYTITLVSVDTNRCHPVDSVTRPVTMLPNVTVDFTVDNACLGYAVQFNNLSNPNAGYNWLFGDGNGSNQYSPSHLYNAVGVYSATLIVTDSATCDITDSLSKNVEVYRSPVANFYVPADTFKFNKEVPFTNRSYYYSNLIWNFGDGTIVDDEVNPVHTYQSIYQHTVCLIATNTACADTACQNIFISFTPLIGVPNAFSPNGDGVNDVVKVEGTGITKITFRIFNRWGEKVFETDDKEQGWDGIYKGAAQEMDVYTYSVDATFINEQTVALKGNITLLR